MDSIRIPKVSNVVWISGKSEFKGTLYLTAHQMLLQYSEQELWFHYSLIHAIDSHGLVVHQTQPYYLLHITCKNMALIRILVSLESEFVDLQKSLSKLINTVESSQLHAFYYKNDYGNGGWSLFNAEKEYNRLVERLQVKNQWRATLINETLEQIPTYPQLLHVPFKITDAVLKYACKFRSKSRIPVLSYLHPTGFSISRCGQPLTGLNMNRSIQDEKLVEAIFTTVIGTGNLLIDARPTANALAQAALGGGTEIESNYFNSKLVFLGIENIHAVRDSMLKVIDLKKSADLTSSSISFEKSGWLKHLKSIIDGCVTIVKAIENSHHVLVHCSDGWDRTPQLTCLAAVCLDPYYRTIHGLAVLIEKEWLSFGHKFNDRCGHISRSTDSSSEQPTVREQIENSGKNVTSFISSLFSSSSKPLEKVESISQLAKSPKEFSPIFTQFLDCLSQLWMQFPTEFEYSLDLLEILNTQVYTCQFGTFLLNSVKERREFRLNSETIGLDLHTCSIWDFINNSDYKNPAFNSNNGTLYPNTSHLIYWSALFPSHGSSGAFVNNSLALDMIDMDS